MKSIARIACLAALAFLGGTAGCEARPPRVVTSTPAGVLEPHGATLVDTAPKEDLRMVPPEVYMRTYLHLFGDLAPMDAQKRARANDNNQLFDTWDDYVSALGFPDYRTDQPRQTQTNALMMAAFERLGVALCDRALEHDWRAPNVAAKDRIVYAWGPPPPPSQQQQQGQRIDLNTFTSHFDVMHRTFLGYPASLAPTPRTARFFQLYRDVEAEQTKAIAGGAKMRFSPPEAGWAAVCYGLVRHPEFHLY